MRNLIIMSIVFFISAVKRLIMINCIQNKSFCLHNICMCTVYIYYVYINTHTNTYSIYFDNIYMHIHIYIYSLIFDIILNKIINTFVFAPIFHELNSKI